MTGLTSSAAPGLSAVEAAARLQQVGPNTLPEPPTPTLTRQVVVQLREPLVLLLIGAALVAIALLGDIKEGSAILAIVVLDVAVGAIQEHRADRAVAALRDLTAPTARVRRDGALRTVAAADVVPGDVVEVAAGDRVPADMRIRTASGLAIDEALLTGESLPVEKAEGDAFAGTLVVRGRAEGMVVATGAASEIGRLASTLVAPPQPPLQVELRGIGRTMALVAVALGALLVPVAAIRSEGDDALLDALLAGVALAVAAIPEGLPAAVTAALALGAQRMARGSAIARRLVAIETLGATTVLLTDKTGTLTTGRVVLQGFTPVDDAAALWTAALRCNDAPAGGTDPIDRAILDAAHGLGFSPSPEPRVAEAPFDTVTRTMATVHRGEMGPALSVKGAPEAVVARCSPSPEHVALLAAAEEAAAEGARVLFVAGAPTDDLAAEGLRLLGMLSFADPLRPSAAQAVADCRRAGIRLVLVTGDHHHTAVSVAREAGLDVHPAVTGADLHGLPGPERLTALRDAAVVARVDPHLKVDLVQAHRDAGDVVAMTGDGVNDAPALRGADVGVALAGDAATDVAREAADLVVTNGDLSTIVGAIREGRRIYRNLANVVGYLVTGNLSEIMVVAAVMALFPALAVPLLPVQLLWINLVTDGIPALALGVDDPPGDVLDLPPRSRAESLLGAHRLWALTGRAVMLAAVVVATGLIARRWGWETEVQRTQLVVTLVVIHLALAYVVRAEGRSISFAALRNRALLGAVGGSVALHVTASIAPPTRAWLGIVALPARGWALAAVGVVVFVVAADAARSASGAWTRRRGSHARPSRDHGP